ncbi:MAG: hypothetical protein HQL73_10100, partial [Magnetococcales bacterium]|nr:hypothetical protein [Magnetococcales bacterium]
MAETMALVSTWFAEIDPRFGCVKGYRATGMKAYSFSSEIIRYPVFSNILDSPHRLSSVDICKKCIDNLVSLFKDHPNIDLVSGDSSVYLREMIQEGHYSSYEPVFYLDAHWGKYWPIRDEIKEILNLD